MLAKTIPSENIDKKEDILMPYTDDDGRLNNFAIEPKMYKAEPTTKAQQRNYLVIAVVAAILVTALIFVASKVG